MATEGNLTHDGTQCTANANFYNPAVALFGVNGSGQFLAVVLSAARVLSIASSATAPIYGILQNTPLATDPADVGIAGISKAVAGAAISAGAELTIDSSGRFITWTAGGARMKMGMAIEAAGALGVVFTMMIYTTNYAVVT